jgi:hypothetical protein
VSNVTREHLFEEIWTEPMTTVAKRYGVSSNYLARICERLKVPRPPRGYWAKVKGAKTVRRAVLPPARPSDERVWRTSGYGLVLPEQPLSVGTVDAPGQHKKKYVRGELHVLVRGAKEKFDRAGHDAEGYLRPEGPEVPDILVAKTTVKRALAFANALFLALEARGHDVVLAPRDRTFVTCGAGLPDEGQSRAGTAAHGGGRGVPRSSSSGRSR